LKCYCCSSEETKKAGRFRNRNGIVQRYSCLRCGKTFSLNPLDGLRIEHGKVVQIVKLLAEGLGIRATARIVDCDPYTVLNVLETIGQKCELLHDRLVRNVQTASLQIDELWAKVGCSQRRANLNHYGEDCGDQYTYLALTAREKFIVSYHTGKRDNENTDSFIADVAERVTGRIQITTDGWQAYPSTIRHYLLERLDYAVMQKLFSVPVNFVDAARRYSPAPFKGIRVRVKAGDPRRDRICTSHVERCNLTVRHFNKRFARLSLGYSKKLHNHRYAISLFVCAYNFCKSHQTLGCTPAVGLRLADHAWTVEELIEKAME
jgi:transposase-like protein/IS1 family transposase